jgi:hypothetical protein
MKWSGNKGVDRGCLNPSRADNKNGAEKNGEDKDETEKDDKKDKDEGGGWDRLWDSPMLGWFLISGATTVI